MREFFCKVGNFFCKRFRLFTVLFCKICLSRRPGELGIARNAHRRLDCQVKIVFQMPRKVVGAKLFLGFQTIFYKIFHPLFRQIEILRKERYIPVAGEASILHNQKVGALLYGHLVFQIVNVIIGRQKVKRKPSLFVVLLNEVAQKLILSMVEPIHVSATMRIRACVVRSEIVLPDGHSRKLHNRAHHALYKLGVIKQEQRYGRITYVYRGDTAVRTAFFG